MITVEIVDGDDRPIIVSRDISVDMKTNLGYVKSPVKVEAGNYLTKTFITSDKPGKAVIEASIETKLLTLKGETEVRFLKS